MPSESELDYGDTSTRGLRAGGDPLALLMDRIKGLMPMVRKLASGQSGAGLGGLGEVSPGVNANMSDKELIQMLLAMMKTQPMGLPNEREVELGPLGGLEDARQDATTQGQVSGLFR
jgi:hypothetical protein